MIAPLRRVPDPNLERELWRMQHQWNKRQGRINLCLAIGVLAWALSTVIRSLIEALQ